MLLTSKPEASHSSVDESQSGVDAFWSWVYVSVSEEDASLSGIEAS